MIRECSDKEYIAKITDYIIEGTVEKAESKWNEEKTSIFTYTDLKIKKYVKGNPFTENKLQIITSGGTVGKISQGIEDQPIFHQGKKVRIYFEKTNGEFSIVCGAMGGVEEIEISAQIANPASVYCAEQNGKLEIRKDKEDNEYGVCIFPNGGECEEWTFYRNECVSWDETIKILNSGQMARIRQVSDLEEVKLENAKELKLKNGKTILFKEPVFDEIFKEIKKCGDLCKNIDIDVLIE